MFVGKGKVLKGPGQEAFNLQTDSPEFVERKRGDYRLTAGSPAIDRGDLGVLPKEIELIPAYFPTMEMRKKVRTLRGALDVGAHEYLGTNN